MLDRVNRWYFHVKQLCYINYMLPFEKHVANESYVVDI